MSRAVLFLLLGSLAATVSLAVNPAHLAAVCGECPTGTAREVSVGPYCGRCIQIRQSCANGFYWEDTYSKCEGCPCRVIDAACLKDTDGLITCRCPANYEGRYCERCSPGFVQESQYPYRCIQTQTRQFPGFQPLPQFPAGCSADPSQPQNLSRTVRSTNGCPLNLVAPNPAYPSPSCPIATSCPSPPNCISPSGCPPPPICPNPTPVNPQPSCPLVPPAPPGGIGPINCPVCPLTTCPSPPAPCPSPSPAPSPCPSPVPVVCPGPTPCPPPIYVTPAPSPCGPSVNCPPNCPTIPACPPFPGCQPIPPWPPIPTCPPIPACPVYPACPIIPACPPNQPCPQIPSCPIYPPCPNIPPWPEIPSCPQLPPIPGCPTCPAIPPCIVPACPPIPTMVCNVTCGCCDKEKTTSRPDPICREDCICDPRGTIRQYCNNCVCKVNVEGADCGSCKPGYFGLCRANPAGCSECFCSGVSKYCTSAVRYRETRSISMNLMKLVDRGGKEHSMRYTSGAVEVTFGSSMSGEFYWVLPVSEVEGSRIVSYGSKISALREYSTSLIAGSVPGNDVIIEGKSGVTLFWSSKKPCTADAEDLLEANIHESDNWIVWRNGKGSVATRSDIMGVLVNVDRILMRAAFTPMRMKKSSISKIRIGSGVLKFTNEGFIQQIEECQCPTGYQGLSCENCSPGFYRDTTDLTRSVFGSCKKCPCGQNSDGCRIEFGLPVCICKAGYRGSRCVDRDFVSVTLDPSRVRDCIGEFITFNCTYACSAFVRVEFETIPPAFRPIETVKFGNGIATTMRIDRSIDRVICKVLDGDPNTSYLIAEVYSRIDAQDCAPPIPIPIGPLIRVDANPKFICVIEGTPVEFNCSAWSFASRELTTTWTRKGRPLPSSAQSNRGFLSIRSPTFDDRGTYYCSGEDSSLTQVDTVVLEVRRKGERSIFSSEREQYDAPSFDVILSTTEGTRTGNIDESNINLDNSTIIDVVENKVALYVSVHPSLQKVAVGQSAEFKCQVAGEKDDELTMYWRKRNGTIRSDVITDGPTIHFNSVRRAHEGEYHCVASNKFGKNSDSGHLYVLDQTEPADAPEAPSGTGPSLDLRISVSPPNQEFRPGDKVLLSCEGNEHDLKFNWSKENGTIRSATTDESNTAHLVLHSVIPADSGWYICSAISPSSEKTGIQRVELVIKQEEIAPTVVISESSPFTVKLGQRVLLECQTYGEPIPVMTWSRFISKTDGDYEKITLLETTSPNSMYEIRRVTKEHEGDYFCTGRNEAGQDQVSIRLIVDEGITCASTEFRCNSGDQCVQLEDRCDKEKDCRDGSDERHCHRRARMTSPNFN